MLANERRYNSSASQVARLKEAGLNPALAYGGSMTTPAPSTSFAGDKPHPVSTAAPRMSSIQAFDPSSAIQATSAARNSRTNEFLSKADSILKMANAKLVDRQEAGQALENLYREQSLESRIGLSQSEWDIALQQAANMRLQNVNLSNELSLFRTRARKLAAEVDSILSNTRLSESRRDEISSNIVRNFADSELSRWQTTLLKVRKDIESQHLSQEEFRTQMQNVTYWNDLIAGDIDILSGAVGNVTGGISKIFTNLFKKSSRKVTTRSRDYRRGGYDEINEEFYE